MIKFHLVIVKKIGSMMAITFTQPKLVFSPFKVLMQDAQSAIVQLHAFSQQINCLLGSLGEVFRFRVW